MHRSNLNNAAKAMIMEQTLEPQPIASRRSNLTQSIATKIKTSTFSIRLIKYSEPHNVPFTMSRSDKKKLLSLQRTNLNELGNISNRQCDDTDVGIVLTEPLK